MTRSVSRILANAAFAVASPLLWAAPVDCVPPNYLVVHCLAIAANPSSGIKNFGFALGEGNPGNLPKAAQFQEIARNSNAAGWAYNPNNPSDTSSVMPNVSSATKAFITINGIFTQADGSDYSPSQITTRLQTLATAIAGKTAYVILGWDEPVWRAHLVYCAPTPVPSGCAAATHWPTAPIPSIVNTVRGKLESWANTVRTQFPGMSLFVVEAHPMVRDSLELPRNFDIYGFDCYGKFGECSGNGSISVTTLKNTIRDKVQAMNTLHGGYRQLALIPESFIGYNRFNLKPGAGAWWDRVENMLNPMNPEASSDSTLLSLMNNYISLAQNEPMVSTVVGFIWSTVYEGDNVFMGIRSWPSTRAAMETFARSVSGKAIPWPTGLPPVIEFQATPNMHVGNGGSVWTWNAYEANTCRSVSEPQYWQNMPSGGGIYRPPEPVVINPPISYTIECTNGYGTTQKTIQFSVAP